MKIVSSLLALALLATVPAFAEDTTEELSQVVSGDVVSSDVTEDVTPAEESTEVENPVVGDLTPAAPAQD